MQQPRWVVVVIDDDEEEEEEDDMPTHMCGVKGILLTGSHRWMAEGFLYVCGVLLPLCPPLLAYFMVLFAQVLPCQPPHCCWSPLHVA